MSFLNWKGPRQQTLKTAKKVLLVKCCPDLKVGRMEL